MIDVLMVPVYLAPIITWFYVLWRSRTSSETGKVPHWSKWTPNRARQAALLGAAAVVLSLVRLQFPSTEDACSGAFANVMNASLDHGRLYFDSMYILSIPLFMISILRRDGRWGIPAVLLVIVGIGACWQASGDIRCPGFP